MKKFMAFSGMCVLLFSCTSCTVNWFEKQYQIPWQMAVIPLILILTIVYLTVWIALGKRIARKTYVCQACGQKFHPKWQSAGFSAHMGNDRVLKCPHCGRRGFCPPSRDGEA